eukprot:GHVN01082087.1.p1 GENE.GHVN01082087.1~~GHVN01082087.1.p1  ORF type:complete len:469 (-),score=59.30 GHVN01082087.1:278-1474(-)
MELCTGKELYARLLAKKKYSESDAKRVTREMLGAINYCHRNHICHRDLKLENWVYASPDEAAPLKLIDFGFSRIFNPGVPMTAMHGTTPYVSPEVLDGNYSEKCDIWSMGVIVYMLLSGTYPFIGETDVETIKKIKNGNFSFPGVRWAGISEEAKAFISHLLVKDPSRRPEAIETLNHPWLSRRMTLSPEIELDVLQNMWRFAHTNHLKRAALGLIAVSMTTQDVSDLEGQFKSLDTDNTGTITLNDLAVVLQERLHMSQEEAEAVFRGMDQTGDSQIHYSEFLASTLQARIFFERSKAEEAFKKFDIDGKGLITQENLRSVLGDSYNGIPIKDLFESVDVTGKGGIDFQMFLASVTGDTDHDYYTAGGSGPMCPSVDGASQLAFGGAVGQTVLHSDS